MSRRTDAKGLQLVRALYPVPVPTETIEEWHRARHEDLAGKSRYELLRERDRLRLRLLLDDDPEPWLVARWHAVAEALARAR